MEYLKGGGRDLISCHFLAIFKSQRAVQETNCWVSDSHEDNINVKEVKAFQVFQVRN